MTNGGPKWIAPNQAAALKPNMNPSEMVLEYILQHLEMEMAKSIVQILY